MNDHLRENEFPSNLEKNSFQLSIPKSLVVALLIVICLQFLGAMINLPVYFNEGFYHITLPLSFLVGSLMAIFVVIPYVKTTWKEISKHIWTPTSIAVIFLSVVMYLLMLPFAEFLTSFIPTTGSKWLEDFYREIMYAFEKMLHYKVAGFITVCILAPIFEEILFRGILLRGLLQNGTSPIIAIILSSFLFGAAHMNPWQFLGAGFLGAIFGYVYYRTKSLWLVMFLHALNNMISFVMMTKYETMDQNVTDPTDYNSVVICFALAILAGWGIFKLTEKKTKWI
ncbi:CPBP family intramembrane glutamic endopeptidase [Moheibacter stercoris]|uniref:Membrane protease YdiL (CAAX protease family) n=1 Tax=Moheibacter stercoris TaxID=1628251 RepID=A0ABV2LWA4_9FLAO